MTEPEIPNDPQMQAPKRKKNTKIRDKTGPIKVKLSPKLSSDLKQLAESLEAETGLIFHPRKILEIGFDATRIGNWMKRFKAAENG